MFKHRETRIHPQKDDKILTDWNGLMISAIARAARIFNNNDYGGYAINAINFITENLMIENGANSELTDTFGRTALLGARQEGYKDIVQLLEASN